MRTVLLASALVFTSACAPMSEYLPSLVVEDAAASRTALEPGLDVVVRVIDGDTVRVASEKKSVRILGIDSPETVHPSRPVECGGPESSDWARLQLPPETPVRLVPDPTQDREDSRGRPLRYLEFQKDGQWLDFSTESARAGMSRSYVFRGKKVQRHDQIKAAEAEARSAGRGLWGHC